MRKSVQESHLLDEFIQEQPTYSADFEVFVLKLLDQEQDIEEWFSKRSFRETTELLRSAVQYCIESCTVTAQSRH